MNGGGGGGGLNSQPLLIQLLTYRNIPQEFCVIPEKTSQVHSKEKVLCCVDGELSLTRCAH